MGKMKGRIKGKIKKLLRYIFIDDKLKRDIGFLRQISVFADLNVRSLAKIALIVFKKNYVAGELIYKEKQEANVFYIVKKGKVSVKSAFMENIVEEKNFFGEKSLTESRRHDSTASAVTDCELYLIYRVKFDDMVDSDAKVGLKIMKNLCSIFETRLKCLRHPPLQTVQEGQKRNGDDRNVK